MMKQLLKKYLVLCLIFVVKKNPLNQNRMFAGANRDAFYLVQSTWLAVCRNCHDWVHAHPKESRALGYLK